MSKPEDPSPAALPIAFVALRILMILNWIGGAGIAVLLLLMPHKEWIIKALKLADSPDAPAVILGLRAVAIIGLVSILLNDRILRRLLAIVDTVRDGDPFIAENARRLQAIAWTLLALQVLSLAVAAIGRTISSPAHPVHFDASFSVNGWLAVLLTFLLARVFAAGTVMRDDLEGTV